MEAAISTLSPEICLFRAAGSEAPKIHTIDPACPGAIYFPSAFSSRTNCSHSCVQKISALTARFFFFNWEQQSPADFQEHKKLHEELLINVSNLLGQVSQTQPPPSSAHQIESIRLQLRSKGTSEEEIADVLMKLSKVTQIEEAVGIIKKYGLKDFSTPSSTSTTLDTIIGWYRQDPNSFLKGLAHALCLIFNHEQKDAIRKLNPNYTNEEELKPFYRESFDYLFLLYYCSLPEAEKVTSSSAEDFLKAINQLACANCKPKLAEPQILNDAVQNGLHDYLKFLTSILKIDPNSFRSPGGATSLHFAAAKGDTVACQILLKSGADKTAQTTKGNTPYQIAVNRGHTELAKLLA